MTCVLSQSHFSLKQTMVGKTRHSLPIQERKLLRSMAKGRREEERREGRQEEEAEEGSGERKGKCESGGKKKERKN